MSSPGPSLEKSLQDLSTDARQSFPTPPRVHWFGLVLAGFVVNATGEWLSRRTGLPLLKELLSSEVFLYVWLCVQASFVQKLKPEKATLLTTLTGGTLLLAAFLMQDQQRYKILIGSLAIGGSILLLVDLFRMRRVLEDHYNSVEPYGLSLNSLWLLLFGPLYLQYHLLKIAMWKDKQS